MSMTDIKWLLSLLSKINMKHRDLLCEADQAKLYRLNDKFSEAVSESDGNARN